MRPPARLLRHLSATLALLIAGVPSAALADDTPKARPNVVWIIVDDMSANFSCYGETTIATPNVDGLARAGVRYSRAFVTAPVCSPCRSALITGMYQTTIGAHHHRSGRGTDRIRLPGEVVPVPDLFRKAGYYTAIGGPLAKGKGLGKTDYNFDHDPKLYDGNDWSGRSPGQPFFMQVQLHGGKYREGKNWAEVVRRTFGQATPPESVVLPPYYPRDPVILSDWAAYLDAVRQTDLQVGEVLRRLDAEGLRESTVVAFMTDHGISHARGKQFLYDEGIHVPLILAGPGVPRGEVRDELVSHIDLTATSLGLAGLPVPPWMQGRDLLAKGHTPRDAVFSARDRCDETVDRIRSVRTDRYKYIRNFYPARPHLQPNRYKDAKPIVARLRALHASGGLAPLQERLLFAPTRPPEEFYDLKSDPQELTNLAADPAHRSTLEALRARLDRWVIEADDRGRNPESPSRYDSDMAVYLNSKAAAQDEVLRANIALMKRWATEGK